MPVHPLFVCLAIAAYLRDTTIEETSGALQAWLPEEPWELESDYRDDLTEFLQDELPDAYVISEHGHSRGRRDILIESRDSGVKVAIELKYQLRSSSEASRLLGQILRYREDVKAIFVILIDPEPNYLAELERTVKKDPALVNVEIGVINSEGEDGEDDDEYEDGEDQDGEDQEE
jgi:hypothetical protein